MFLFLFFFPLFSNRYHRPSPPHPITFQNAVGKKLVEPSISSEELKSWGWEQLPKEQGRTERPKGRHLKAEYPEDRQIRREEFQKEHHRQSACPEDHPGHQDHQSLQAACLKEQHRTGRHP